MTTPDLAQRLGLKRSGRDWRGTCPACGYGAGAFVLSTGRSGKPVGWCASCQDRAAIRAVIGGDAEPIPTPARTTDTTDKRASAERLWLGAVPVLGTVAETYLRKRGLPTMATCAALRFRPDCPHPNAGKLPAMLARIDGPDGAFWAAQRTYLKSDGSKARAAPVRATLGPMWGGAVRLAPIDPTLPLVIAEGTETAASAGLLTGFPAWAAVNAGNLARGLTLPPAARDVIIAADPDPPGRAAARDAWIRWRAEGRAVRIATPTGTGDFNDILIEREAAHAA